MLILLLFPFLVAYIWIRLTCGISKSAKCLVGKTAIITGGNAGVGYQVCLNLAARGCRVIIADRDDSEASRKNIIQYTGNRNIVSKHLDLNSFQSIRTFAKEINQNEPRLDILINNAGSAGGIDQVSKDGFNVTLQVNLLGPFLLTHLLVDLLKKSAPSRIILTSSCVAFLGNVRALNLSQTFTYGSVSSGKPYPDSKLANIMIADIFSEKLKQNGVTVNSVHPGLVHTAFHKATDQYVAFWPLLKFINFIEYIYSKNAWEGAQTTVHVAVSNKCGKLSGKYFWDCKPFIKPWQAYDKKLRQEIWNLSEKMVGLSKEEKL